MLNINKNLCNGCRGTKLSRCEIVCPGSLLVRDGTGKISSRDPMACWDCTACVKQCHQNALSITLPFAISTSDAKLMAEKKTNTITWTILSGDDANLKQIKIIQ
jgi:adenylylsulfate reductase subunit B